MTVLESVQSVQSVLLLSMYLICLLTVCGLTFAKRRTALGIVLEPGVAGRTAPSSHRKGRDATRAGRG